MSTARVLAPEVPIAQVLPLLGLPQLDRYFDYQIDAKHHDEVQPGVRVRIRFGGRLVDALVVSRSSYSEHDGKLSWIERVISPDVVYPLQTRELIDALCERYAGVRSDLIRSAIPARHAQAEHADTRTPWAELGEAEEPDLSQWSSYAFGQSFVDAVLAGAKARAAWQIAPGEDWATALAALAIKTVIDGGGALIVVPDQRDVDALETACKQWVSAKQITVLGSALGPQARYRRFLSVLHGQGRLVIGTRSAAFAPVQNLRLAVVLHDGDENLCDPRAPYVHAREVLTMRSAKQQCALIIGGHSRTAETQLMVEQGWLHNLVAPRDVIRTRMPHIRAAGDSDFALERDPRAGSARLPQIAFQAVREAFGRGEPVLVQVPRKGYVPTLACGNCRAPARCRHCNGPLGLPTGGEAAVPTCRWCGRPSLRHRCGECGSVKLRAVVLGAGRTAEELGRAFPGVKVVTSGGAHIIDSIGDGPQLVVATPGAEPKGRYGALLLLDTWALLGRQDLRATEDTLAKWAAAATLVHRGGDVVIMANPGLSVVQSLIRWDMVQAAAFELAERREVDFPPAVRMAAIDAPGKTLDHFLELIELPEGGEILGPVDLPLGVHLPGEYDEQKFGFPQRVLVRVPVVHGMKLGKALRAAQVARATRKDTLPLRVQIDPLHIG
ncbi:primosomal protein N' [Corynebacterium freiburgense]|uniref:primosomal protein N' n=1 Tax=Corynebacterium freiburgense TaxID=556548 RepID=UPI00047AB121|nr:primosomal protein N' [Corynebacterium freiburgense]WJZ02762.1 Primosomal protein N' [Corynebacterium freiburgense]